MSSFWTLTDTLASVKEIKDNVCLSDKCEIGEMVMTLDAVVIGQRKSYRYTWELQVDLLGSTLRSSYRIMKDLRKAVA